MILDYLQKLCVLKRQDKTFLQILTKTVCWWDIEIK